MNITWLWVSMKTMWTITMTKCHQSVSRCKSDISQLINKNKTRASVTNTIIIADAHASLHALPLAPLPYLPQVCALLICPCSNSSNYNNSNCRSNKSKCRLKFNWKRKVIAKVNNKRKILLAEWWRMCRIWRVNFVIRLIDLACVLLN